MDPCKVVLNQNIVGTARLAFNYQSTRQLSLNSKSRNCISF